MDSIHVSMASGGAYVALYGGFWERLELIPAGLSFRKKITSFSGSSAGALTGATLALGVPASRLAEDVRSGGMGRHKYARAIAVALGMRKSMYSGKHYYNRFCSLCSRAKYNRVPVHIAVTDQQLVQRVIPYRVTDSAENVMGSAVASASIPWVLPARVIPPYGQCVDGSVSRSSFPVSKVLDVLRNRSGQLILFNCCPWPGFRKHTGPTTLAARLRYTYGDALYNHGMESIGQEIRGFMFRDGIYDIRVDNMSGPPRVSSKGNLHVIFVAPTSAQFELCGGNDSIARLDYRKRSPVIEAMLRQGRAMANEFAVRYCTVQL